MRFEPIPANFLSLPKAILLAKRFTVSSGVVPRLDLGYMDVLAEGLSDQQISDTVNAYNTLVMQTTSNSVGINEVATITGLPSFDYVIRLDDIAIQVGTANDGILNFSSDTIGVYLIEIISGIASGYVEVTVS